MLEPVSTLNAGRQATRIAHVCSIVEKQYTVAVETVMYEAARRAQAKKMQAKPEQNVTATPTFCLSGRDRVRITGNGRQ